MYVLFCHLNLWVIFREATCNSPLTFILFWSTCYFYSILKHRHLFEKMDPKIEEMANDNDYVANFDPKVYLETYFCKIEGHMFIPTTLKSQHKIYSTANWLFFFYVYYHRRSLHWITTFAPFFNFLFAYLFKKKIFIISSFHS